MFSRLEHNKLAPTRCPSSWHSAPEAALASVHPVLGEAKGQMVGTPAALGLLINKPQPSLCVNRAMGWFCMGA